MDSSTAPGLIVVLSSMISVTLLFLLLASLMWWLWRRIAEKEGSRLPGTFGLPVLGETLKYIAQMKTPIGNFVDEHSQRYGMLFKSSLFFKPTAIAAELATVKMIVAKEGKSFVSSYPASFAMLLGRFNGLNLQGDDWKRMRRFVVGNIMRPDLLKNRMNEIEDLVLDTLNAWEETRTVVVEDDTKTLAFNITALIVLNIRPGVVSEKLQEDYYPLIGGMFSIPINLPWTLYGKAAKARERILMNLSDFLESRAEETDLYDRYLEVLRNELPKGLPEIRKHEMAIDLLISLMFAGHDTTATTMVFAVKYIGENLRVLVELRAEHEEVLKRKETGERLNWDDCKRMPFSNHVITETLRMCNISSTVFRKSLEDVPVGEHVIPKGWAVLPYFRAIHFNPSIFPDPQTFNPWRYQASNGSKLPFFGFGGGARFCPGMELARAEICLFLHHLVMKFESWELTGEDIPSFFPFPRLSKRLPIIVKKRA